MYKCTCSDCGRDFTTFDPSWWCDDCRKKRFEKDKKKKPQTNADRIRAMSDEELAEFLENESWLCDSYTLCIDCPMFVKDRGCSLTLIDWLKQPAEE